MRKFMFIFHECATKIHYHFEDREHFHNKRLDVWNWMNNSDDDVLEKIFRVYGTNFKFHILNSMLSKFIYKYILHHFTKTHLISWMLQSYTLLWCRIITVILNFVLCIILALAPMRIYCNPSLSLSLSPCMSVTQLAQNYKQTYYAFNLIANWLLL